MEKCPPKGKTGNVPPGAEAPHNPRLCLPTAPWTDLTPTPPPRFLHPAEAAGRAARGPPPTARLQPLRTPAAAGNRPRASGFPGSVRGASTVEVAAVGVSIPVLRARLRSPDGGGGGGGSERPGPSQERAALPWAAGAASAASVAARPARFGPARIRNLRARRGSPPPPRRRRAGSSSPRRDARSSLLPRLTDSRGRRILPRSLRASLGLFPHPLPVGARAHTHTHTHTRRRACARPRARSRGISGAATHTGFQPPLGVLCLRQRRPRRRRGRRLQPGPVSELGAQDRVRGRSGEGGRGGEEEPRRARPCCRGPR